MKVQFKTDSNFVRVSLVIAMGTMLAACGGGGDGSSAAPVTVTPVTPVVTPTSVPISTGVSATTYAANGFQALFYTGLNNYRLQMGVGTIAQDPVLDTAAAAHSLYLDANLANHNITALTHNEVSTYADFFGLTPLARADAAGANPTEWIAEDVAAGVPVSASADAQSCLSTLLDTVYHLQGATGDQQTIGIGYHSGLSSYFLCTADFGVSSYVSGTPQPNSLPLSGGQQLATTAIVHAPLANETGLLRTMTAETINPAPDLLAPGHPFIVRVNAASSGDVLTVTSYTLTDSSGNSIPARIIVPQAAIAGSTSSATADVNNELYPGVAVLLPLTTLPANTTVTAAFKGERNGTPIAVTWSSTTGAQ